MKHIGTKFFFYTCIIGIFFSSCNSKITPPEEVALAMSQLSKPMDYTYDIKPILSDRCFACHGPDANKQKAGLRLDIQEAAYQQNEKSGNYAIVAGKSAKSELVNRILSQDPEVVMPTPESHLSLSTLEKAKLIKWIEEGAPYKEHWSLLPITKTELPTIKNKSWPSNEIDYFTLSKMEENGLQPNSKADPTTLLRRVYLDLTGLPPTPAKVAAYLNNKSANKYEQVVEELLASPQYGEHMAVPWLDAARYADTHGYQDDMMRTAWPFREWVINAFNKNLSYDLFVKWQLAGDLLPNPTTEQMVATAFNRMHQQSMEGGIIAEEYRSEYVADRVNTFGTTFLGMTIECARCHDHKYDPISQKDYYSLAAFFNNINENGQIPYNGESSPGISLPSPEAEKRLNFIKNDLVEEHESRVQIVKNMEPRFQAWLTNASGNLQKATVEANQDLYGHFTFDEPTGTVFQNLALKDHVANAEGGDSLSQIASKPGRFGKSRHIFGENSIDFGANYGYFERNEPFSLSIWLNLHDPKTDGSIIHKSNHITSGFRGWNVFRDLDGRIRLTFSYVWPDNAIELKTVDKFPLNKWTHLAFSYNGLSKASGLKLYIDGQLAPVQIYNDHLTQSILYGKNKTNIVVHNLKIGRLQDRFTKNFEVDELKLFKRALSPLEIKSLYSQNDEISKILRKSVQQRSASDQKNLRLYYLRNVYQAYQNSMTKSQALIGEETEILNSQPDVMVMKERKFLRKSFVLNRGAYDAPGEEVHARTPLKMGVMNSQFPKNRLGLAQWLISDENTLFARVAVNRFWQQYFGNGLVNTSNDFGNQGSLPTHPDLLDWLASEFRNSSKNGPWNVKALQKLIVMSATYQQSSYHKLHPEKDPENQYYTKGPSYRLSAEQIRDNALVASGLITKRIGGPSVYPYQPNGIWEAISNYGKYQTQSGDTLYRRSMYTVWKRTSPPPMMLNFDAAERAFCVVKRQKTSTPLQSLVVMNDPQFIEASRVLAQRMLVHSRVLNDQITYAFVALTSRKPNQNELAILKDLYEEEYDAFSKNPSKAQLLIHAGEFPVDKKLNSIALAANTIVASTIMNFDEFVIKR